MEDTNNIDANVCVYMINKYIEFYKKQIKNSDFFDGMSLDDLGSTSEQMELFNTEMEKYKNLGIEFKKIYEIHEIDENDNTNNKKYAITKNSKKFLISDSLLSLLNELYYLEEEDVESSYNIIIDK